MRNIFIILVMALVLAFPALAATGGVEALGASLELTLLKYEPVPAYPGDVMDVWVKLENAGGDLARDVKLEFLDNYPFILQSDERRVHNIGTLSGGYDYVAKFQVRVAKSATPGTSYIKAKYSTSDSSEVLALMAVDIDSRITSLSIEGVTVEPEQLEPGQKGTITLHMKNLAESMQRNVKVKLELEASDAPLAPVLSATELKINQLAPGETHDFTFNVQAELDATPNVYTIPVNFSYTEDTGDEVAYEDLIGILVTSDPDLVLTIDSTDIYSDDPSGSVTLKFVNKGVDEIKFLYVTLGDSDTYELLSPTTKYYVGNIDSDDYEVEEILLKAKNSDKIEMPMELEYRDAANNRYTRKETLTVNIISKEELNGEESNTSTYVILFVVVVVIGFFIWRRRKKAKEDA
ncbi:COG1361 S-layer family protein [Nanoarchaeota archaeon]